jgi:AcrR family transcriptional regulator
LSSRGRDKRRLSAPARRELIARAAADAFAERGYHGASIDEICRRSGCTAPVLYDHFASKRELHRYLLERTRDELLQVWRDGLAGNEPAERRIPRAVAAWAAYVEAHPYVARMFFAETTGDPEIAAIHREVRGQATAALGVILGTEAGGAAGAAGGAGAAGDAGAAGAAGASAAMADGTAHEMAAEVVRSGLAGLAIWWSEHPEVPREQVVATALNVLWIGLERVRRGETWRA